MITFHHIALSSIVDYSKVSVFHSKNVIEIIEQEIQKGKDIIELLEKAKQEVLLIHAKNLGQKELVYEI